MDLQLHLKKFIAEIPDFPKKDILFYDISPLLQNPEAWKLTVDAIAEKVKELKADVIVGLESRGFLVSSAVAYALNMGFVMIRKKGKLPGELVSYSYNLEYGSDTLEIKKDAIKPNQKVVILDDLLATGGSINASCELIKKVGAIPLASICIIELLELKGRNNISIPIHTILQY